MYDPTLPANNSPLSSPEMRTQLTGLRDFVWWIVRSAGDLLRWIVRSAGEWFLQVGMFVLKHPPSQRKLVLGK